MQGRLILRTDEHKARATRMGITDYERIYTHEDMAKGDVYFSATGVTPTSRASPRVVSRRTRVLIPPPTAVPSPDSSWALRASVVPGQRVPYLALYLTKNALGSWESPLTACRRARTTGTSVRGRELDLRYSSCAVLTILNRAAARTPL